SVSNCYIGTDLTGKAPMPGNAGSGIFIAGPDNSVWSSPSIPNVIVSNGASGVHIKGIDAVRNTVSGSLIGLDVTGNTSLGNSGYGVLIDLEANGNTVGGPTTNERNIISGNSLSGISIDRSNSTKVWANYIGLGKDGTTILANGADGITLSNGASSTQI